MSVAAAPTAMMRVARLYESTLGKKMVMAVTGVMLFGFVIAHLIGNLQFYLGPETLNAYGAALHRLGPVLWLARLCLLTAVALHIFSAVQLWRINRVARPIGYRKLSPVASSYASRTMMLSGPILAAFIIYHLLHFTVGTVHPKFSHQVGGAPEVYHNVVAGFQQIPVSIAYIVAMGFLGFHLMHGVWSMFQSVGWNHPKYTPLLRTAAVVMAALIVLGNISIPISVMLGFHQ
ncbi:MAG: succinate dehydrogenase cytochrome b subunit [Acidobacteriia bacterium]|nr:succinate dehydrogenase cytochrome b subunit [Terriglobia bacterium]